MIYVGQKMVEHFFTKFFVSSFFIYIFTTTNGANGFVPAHKFNSQKAPVALIIKYPRPISKAHSSLSLSIDSNLNGNVTDTANLNTYSHENVHWKIKPWLKKSPEKFYTPKAIITTSSNLVQKSILKVASNLIRLDCKLKNKSPPKVLCPRSGQAVLEAFVKREKGLGALLPFKKKIANFGITTHRGPPAPQITASIEQIYNTTAYVEPGVAAIIYMYVEPDYRSGGLGELALEVISSIHAFQRCDFTILVADDDGSGKLVEWYNINGFEKAPLLQEVMGSPGGKFGTTMIRPTAISSNFSENCKIQWW